MSAEPQLFRINPDNRESEKIAEVDFARLGFQERRDIQEWVAANPGILGEDLLIIGKEFSGFDRVNERLDLLAVDAEGKLVVIELKRDDTGADAHWQAIKYASYLRHASTEDLVRMLADHEGSSESDAEAMLLQHLNAEDLNALNNSQRIILASHRFAPEVTSAALWLNEKVPDEDLLTCVQLTPFQDSQTDTLYVQANAIIPVPGIDKYIIKPGELPRGSVSRSRRRKSSAWYKNDSVTIFLKRVADLVRDGLEDRLKPNRRSMFAHDRGSFRRFQMWYSRPPWGNWKLAYMINLSNHTDGDLEVWTANLGLKYKDCGIENFESWIDELRVYDDQWLNPPWDELLVTRRDNALDESFADTIAESFKHFIEVVTPTVDQIMDEINEEEA